MQNHLNAIIIGSSILVGAILIAIGLRSLASEPAFAHDLIEVVGEAQWQVNANQIIWPIAFKAGDNNLQNLYKSVTEQTEMISAFLLLRGVTTDEITVKHPQVIDRATLTDAEASTGEFRYIASQRIVISSQNIEGVEAAMSKLPSLIAQGILLYDSNTPEYFVTELNQLRPKMAIQARENAHQLAQEVAVQSHAVLGHLRQIKLSDLHIDSSNADSPRSKTVKMTAKTEHLLTIAGSKSQ